MSTQCIHTEESKNRMYELEASWRMMVQLPTETKKKSCSDFKSSGIESLPYLIGAWLLYLGYVPGSVVKFSHFSSFYVFFSHMFLFDKRPCLQLEALVRSVICSWRGISRNLCTNSSNSWRDPLQDTLKEIDDEDAFDPQTSVIYRMLTSPLGERLVPHYGDGALATCPEELHIYVKTTRSKFLKVNGCFLICPYTWWVLPNWMRWMNHTGGENLSTGRSRSERFFFSPSHSKKTVIGSWHFFVGSCVFVGWWRCTSKFFFACMVRP